MDRFWDIVVCPVVEAVGAKFVVELGYGKGLNTGNVLEYCVDNDARMVVIDPFPQFDVDIFRAKYGDRFEIFQDLSLDVLPLLSGYDVILIDGDPNWYSVYNELKIIEKTFVGDDFPVVFVHDVGWPYGRRDAYYDPESIPGDFRQPYEKLGLFPGRGELLDEGGFNSCLNNAIYENNCKNGVLAGVEDFIRESELDISFEFISAFNGLGILYLKDANIDAVLKRVFKDANLLDVVEEERMKLRIFFSESAKQNKVLKEQLMVGSELKSVDCDFNGQNRLLGECLNAERGKVKVLESRLGEVESQLDESNVYLDFLCNRKGSFVQKLFSKFPSLYIFLKAPKTGLKNAFVIRRGYKAILENNLFDVGYYLKNSVDILRSGQDPLLHYLYHGYKEGRNPNSDFDGEYYLYNHGDVKKSGLNPLVHYSLYGLREGRLMGDFVKKQKTEPKPKVSIITASYNYAHLIENAINSVINQTYNNWELIIVDDGSEDNSTEIIRKYTKKYSNIKLYQHNGNVNKGLKETIILGLKYSKGEYIAFLESDDWLENNYLDEKIRVIEQNPDVKFIFNDVNPFSQDENFDLTWYTNYLKEQRTILRNEQMPCNCEKYFVKHNFIPTFSCVFVEKNLLLSCDFNTPSDPALDYWLFKQLASKTDFYYVNKKLTHWMMHKDSYINEIFIPVDEFSGFGVEEPVLIESKLVQVENELKTTLKKLDNFEKQNNAFVESLYRNNPNQNSNCYVEKSNRHFQRRQADVKLIAFYLPQFHTIKENDEWWGKGFTEWTNVTKAQPTFLGHYQPHLPDELGFYDLSDDEVMHKQIVMAKKYGLYGFCFHYYWFSGKRLLEKPIFNFLNNKELDFPFMLCWANESWRNTWTCTEGEVLMPQNFEADDYLKFIQDIMPFFKDERYIKIDNKPVLIVYRPHFFSKEQFTAAIKIWRDYVKKEGFDDLYVMNTRTSGGLDLKPVEWSIDATVEFPPNDMVQVPNNDEIHILNPDFKGRIFNLPKSIDKTINSPPVDYTIYKTVFPSWDNTARRDDLAQIFIGSSPEVYKKWLLHCIKYAQKNFKEENRFVFINAWNEWAEADYLEPDRKYGFAYLEATLDALKESRMQ